MVVPDGEPVGAAIRALLTQQPAVVITSGGTGLSPDDRTPEMTLPLLDREIPGIMEGIRQAGTAKTPHAMLSRGHAGAAGTDFHHQPARITQGGHGRSVRPGPGDRAPVRPVGGRTWRTEASFEVVTAVLSAEPISVDQAIAAVESETAGAVVSFSGVVRNHDGGKPVDRLSYSAHPTARKVLADVVAQLVAEQAAAAGRRHGSAGPDLGRAPGGAAGNRRPCPCLRRIGRPPRAGLRRVLRARGPGQGAGADLEGTVLQRRHRRVGRGRGVRARSPAGSRGRGAREHAVRA